MGSDITVGLSKEWESTTADSAYIDLGNVSHAHAHYPLTKGIYAVLRIKRLNACVEHYVAVAVYVQYL